MVLRGDDLARRRTRARPGPKGGTGDKAAKNRQPVSVPSILPIESVTSRRAATTLSDPGSLSETAPQTTARRRTGRGIRRGITGRRGAASLSGTG
jgi:hypothetical protein